MNAGASEKELSMFKRWHHILGNTVMDPDSRKVELYRFRDARL